MKNDVRTCNYMFYYLSSLLVHIYYTIRKVASGFGSGLYFYKKIYIYCILFV